MATDHESRSHVEEILEEPHSYTLEQLEAVFDVEDIRSVAVYQEVVSADPHDLFTHPFPQAFVALYRSKLPMLTYNTMRYPDEIEAILQTDVAIQTIFAAPNTHDRARAICARRSVIAFLLAQGKA